MHCSVVSGVLALAAGLFKGFKLIPKRWVSERTFGWLNKYRLLSKEYEVLIESSEADIYLAMIHVMTRRLAPEDLADRSQLSLGKHLQHLFLGRGT
jgi:hypothetical protein